MAGLGPATHDFLAVDSNLVGSWAKPAKRGRGERPTINAPTPPKSPPTPARNARAHSPPPAAPVPHPAPSATVPRPDTAPRHCARTSLDRRDPPPAAPCCPPSRSVSATTPSPPPAGRTTQPH